MKNKEKYTIDDFFHAIITMPFKELKDGLWRLVLVLATLFGMLLLFDVANLVQAILKYLLQYVESLNH